VKPPAITRRSALQAAAIAAAAFPSSAANEPWPLKPDRPDFGGLRVGLTTYSTRELTLDETIALLQQTGVTNIALKYFHLPLDSTKEQRRLVVRKIEDAGLTLAGCGVIGLSSDEQSVRRSLDYVRDIGAPTVTATPPIERLEQLDRIIKDYGEIRIAIHTHGPEDNVNYWRWSAVKIMNQIRWLDRRIGVCVDVGHTFRVPIDPVEAIRACGDRLYDVHLKDLKEASRRRLDVPMGRGVIDIPAITQALRERNYRYHVALEYEAEPEAPQLGIAESFGYLRGVLSPRTDS
jgi:sugar phosphate isomerase/epimerase